MTLVDLAELPRLLAPQLSPDGRTLAYFLSAPDWKAGRPVFHLWRQAVAGGAPKQLTFSEGGDIPAPNTLRWSPDGRTLLFLREGQVWLLAPDGGEPRAAHASRDRRRARRRGRTTVAAVYFIASDPRTPEERERDRASGDVLRLRRRHQTAAALEDRRRDRRRDASHDRRHLRARVPVLGGRDAHRTAAGTVTGARGRLPRRSLGDGRGRRARAGR